MKEIKLDLLEVFGVKEGEAFVVKFKGVDKQVNYKISNGALYMVNIHGDVISGSTCSMNEFIGATIEKTSI